MQGFSNVKMATLHIEKQQLFDKEEAERLFSKAVTLFSLESPIGDSDSASWAFCYDWFRGHLCTSASLLHGKQVYAQIGEESGRGTNNDDFITLSVAGNLRAAVVDGGSSSIDDFVRERSARLTGSRVDTKIGYVVPNPEWFERMIPGYPEYASVLVSMIAVAEPNERFSPNLRVVREKLVSEVIVSPVVLARELSLMTKHVLSGSEGGYPRLRATLADYITGYLAPRLGSLQQPVLR